MYYEQADVLAHGDSIFFLIYVVVYDTPYGLFNFSLLIQIQSFSIIYSNVSLFQH